MPNRKAGTVHIKRRACTERLEARRLLAAAVTYLGDLNPETAASTPTDLTQLDGVVYFSADDGTHGRELWRSDGTAAGTTMVVDADPGTGSGMAIGGATKVIAAAGGKLFFAATDGASGTELWSHDPATGAAARVADINAGPASSNPKSLTAFGTRVYFAADGGGGDVELWTSDGTAGGTYRVRDIRAGAAPSDPAALTVAGGALYFAANDGVTGLELWRVGAPGGEATPVADINPGAGGSTPRELTAYKDALYFVAADANHGAELWTTTGTAATTALVKDVNPYSIGPATAGPNLLTVAGQTLYFQGSDGTNISALWKSDGTTANTSIVRDITTGNAMFDLEPVGKSGDAIVISTADNNAYGQVFVSDGTHDGTTLIWTKGRYGIAPSNMTRVDGRVFFHADDAVPGVLGDELYVTDGTAAGTRLVADVRPGASGSSPGYLLNVGGTLFFAAGGGTTVGRELWKSDGTADGTVLVEDINPTRLGSTARGFVTSGGRVFFAAHNANTGIELFKTDGTAAGTTLVKDVRPGAAWGLPASPVMADVAGTLYFIANDGVHGNELWKSDGTEAGTVMVKDISSGSRASEPQAFLAVGNTLYFTADAMVGRELWRSDGTPEGTVLVKDIRSRDSHPRSLTELNGLLFFIASTDDYYGTTKLFRSDGTDAGTFPIDGPTDITDVVVFKNRIYFVGRDTNGYPKLWATDGTTAAAERIQLPLAAGSPGTPFNVQQLTAAGGALYFQASSDQPFAGLELWKSDGTAAGTAMLKDIEPGSGSSKPEEFFEAGGLVYFMATTVAHGTEMWVTDGTAAGTHILADLTPGPGRSYFGNFTTVNKRFLFTTTTPNTYTNDLWSTDGTEAGTVVLRSTARDGRAWREAAGAGGVAYFEDWTAEHGEELWRTDGTPQGTAMVQDLLPGPSGSGPYMFFPYDAGFLFTAEVVAGDREVFHVDHFAELIGGTLHVRGTAGDDTITLGSDGTTIVARRGGIERSFATSAVESVVVQPGGGADRLAIESGTFAFDADLRTHSRNLAVDVGDGAHVLFRASQRLTALAIGKGASATLSSGSSGAGGLLLATRDLAIADTGKLDLRDNDLVIDYTGASIIGAPSGSTYVGVTGLLQSGYNGGAWDGDGIVTSMPDAPTGLTTLAIGEASNILGITGSETATWNGQSVDATTVIVKYTYGGDTNFDGKLDADDYGTIDFAVLVAGSYGYHAGDFNLDGKVDADDYGVIDFNILAQDAVL